MRHGLMACAAVLALVGCDTLAKPHNDVLIFGTTTKVALDVSAPVQNGALPEFTLGYKRNEAVWMPLKANGAGDLLLRGDPDIKARFDSCMKNLANEIADEVVRKKVCAGAALPPDKYLAWSEGVNGDKGGSKMETDTYSVFASFGGRGGLGFNSSSGQLAQFFATGIAAQRLGANPNVGMALNAEAPAAIEKQADADKAYADAVAEKLAKEKEQLKAIDAAWGDCADPEKENAKFITVVDKAAESGIDPLIWPLLKKAKSKTAALDLLDVQAPTFKAAFKTALAEVCTT